MERIMTDREFIVWLSGYIDAKPDAVDENIKKQLDKQVVSVIRHQLLDALKPNPPMPHIPPSQNPWKTPIAGVAGGTGGRMVGSSVAWNADPALTGTALAAEGAMASVGHTTVPTGE